MTDPIESHVDFVYTNDGSNECLNVICHSLFEQESMATAATVGSVDTKITGVSVMARDRETLLERNEYEDDHDIILIMTMPLGRLALRREEQPSMVI